MYGSFDEGRIHEDDDGDDDDDDNNDDDMTTNDNNKRDRNGNPFHGEVVGKGMVLEPKSDEFHDTQLNNISATQPDSIFSFQYLHSINIYSYFTYIS